MLAHGYSHDGTFSAWGGVHRADYCSAVRADVVKPNRTRCLARRPVTPLTAPRARPLCVGAMIPAGDGWAVVPPMPN